MDEKVWAAVAVLILCTAGVALALIKKLGDDKRSRRKSEAPDSGTTQDADRMAAILNRLEDYAREGQARMQSIHQLVVELKTSGGAAEVAARVGRLTAAARDTDLRLETIEYVLEELVGLARKEQRLQGEARREAAAARDADHESG